MRFERPGSNRSQLLQGKTERILLLHTILSGSITRVCGESKSETLLQFVNKIWSIEYGMYFQ